jgi:membrane protein
MTARSRIPGRLPLISWVVAVSSKLKLPGMGGVTFYDLVETYALGIVKGAFSSRASAISYSFFMALFPFILFILNLISFVPIKDFQADFLEFLHQFLPPGAVNSFDTVFMEIAEQENTGLLTIAFAASIFLMANGVNAVFEGFQRSYHQEMNRNMVRQYIVALALSILLAIMLLISVVVVGYVQYLLEDINAKYLMGEDSNTFWLVFVRYAILIFLLFVFICTLYYAGTKSGRESRFFNAGAIFTTLLILFFGYLFGLYIENFSTYNEIYGSLGAILILMVFIWLNSNLLLLGYELNASIRKLKAQSLKEKK